MSTTNAKLIPNIAVLDSGIGGLSILAPLRAAIPQANFEYVADYQLFPYGRLSPEEVCARLEKIFRWLEEHNAIDAFVLACNTASTASLPHLRRLFRKPIIGVVPPIKLAALLSRTHVIAVLATKATAFNVYTQDLIAEYAKDCRVLRVGSAELVQQAENKLHGRPVDLAKVKEELRELLAESKLDALALACTHFPHLVPEFEQVGLKPTHWVVPNEGVVKRVIHVLEETKVGIAGNATGQGTATAHIFTRNAEDIAELREVFSKAGMRISGPLHL